MHHPGLDGLRAIAVLLVLYDHAPQVLGRDRGGQSVFWSASPGAWIGVDLFFVLSGFLITSILLRSVGEPGAFRRFWLRRALRIFPLAYLYLGVLALCAWLLPGFAQLADPNAYAWAAGYLLNVRIAVWGWTPAALGILWSLAVEEHFYCVWPLVVLRARRAVVAWVLIVTVAATPLLRWLLLPSLGQVGVYVLTCCRWDTLAWGALLAMAWHSPHRERLRRMLAWAAWPALAVVASVLAVPVHAVDPHTPAWFHVVGYSAIAGAFTVVVGVAMAPPVRLGRWLGQPLLGHVGRISYGLYVWHVLAAQLTTHALGLFGIGTCLSVRAGLWLVLLFAMATASYRWFEAPLLRVKDRIR